MKQFRILTLVFFPFACLYFCNNPVSNSDPLPSGLSGDQLARNYCGSCHEYVSPGYLTKSIWKNDVHPAMGHRLGIYAGDFRPDSLLGSGPDRDIIQKAHIFPEQPVMAKQDWEKIIDFYVTQAPDTLNRERDYIEINDGLQHFDYREVQYSRHPPLTTLVKILPDHRGIVYADTKPIMSKLIFLDADLQKDMELNFKTAPVHYTERSDTLYLTTIGKNPFPNDRLDGDLQMVYREDRSQPYNKSKIILPDLKRPVYVEYGDIDQDGLEDVVVSEFGNYTGQLSLYINGGGGNYKKMILKRTPGTIHTEIIDLDSDGYLDIVALMSQGQEGVYYFKNNGPVQSETEGDQMFSEKQLLSFSPLNGSQYFELRDFNQDGHQDILYVCGDNADKTPVLKSYHGIYIFLNDGHQNFEQSYFFHQNGAYKALARDFDLDGDLDIASISFYPDYVDRPEESFVYLENTGDMKFTPYSFPQATRGRWMVMDATDMDSDGDLDLALGSFVYFVAKGDTTGLSERWMAEGPSVIILENTLR